MNHLLREAAPIAAEAWAQIEAEARRTIETTLAGRRLIDLSGPKGWRKSAVAIGRTERLAAAPVDGAEASMRKVQPLVELRIPFELDRSELDAIERGASDPDLGAVTEAARKAALAEDTTVFEGYPAAGIAGLGQSTSHPVVRITDDYEKYPAAVARAVSHLRAAGVSGPYAIALGSRCFTGLAETTSHGYPVMQHVRRIIDGPLVWAPAVSGAIVLSQRGDDYQLTIGQDFSIGYSSHTASAVKLYIEESLTFRVLSPEAHVVLRYAA
jgi:uncharacterized linocin/CFP29 family protein